MARKSIVWTKTAVRQRREILRYWVNRNKSNTYSKKLVKKIKNKVTFISENPEAGKLTNHKDSRESAMGNFSIYYQIIEESIIITAFWDNRQDPDELIKILKS